MDTWRARTGLEVVGAKGYRTTTSLKLPKELPSVEDALNLLTAALETAAGPGLDKVEVQRLPVMATLARTGSTCLGKTRHVGSLENQGTPSRPNARNTSTSARRSPPEYDLRRRGIKF